MALQLHMPQPAAAPGNSSGTSVTKRASLGNESEGGFLPRDLPISWASYLALASTGTFAVVLESKSLSSGAPPELPWTRGFTKVSGPVLQ